MASKRRIEGLEDGIRDAIGALEALLANSAVKGRGSVLSDLIYRAEVTAKIDGYPRGGSQERTRGGGLGDSTLGSVVARLEDVCERCEAGRVKLADGRIVSCRQCQGTGRRFSDPVGDALVKLLKNVGIVARGAKSIDRHRESILGEERRARERVLSVGSCLICGETVTGIGEDRLRRGLDPRCYLSFGGWKLRNLPDRGEEPGEYFRRFVTWRLGSLAKSEEARTA